MTKNNSFYIDRDNIVKLVKNAVASKWNNFSVDDLVKKGNAYRCVITVENKQAFLDCYFNADGTTTIRATGKNLEISNFIKEFLENGCKSSKVAAKTFSIKGLPQEWAGNLIGYLSGIKDISTEQKDIDKNPVHTAYIFTSKLGDKLTVNLYNTGTLTLQGKPAYLYGEAISFLSYCDKFSLDSIVESVNAFHNTQITTKEVRNDIECLMPNAYNNIDDTIFKMLSPAISLKNIQVALEDYSCYAFPALRALEGYIKYLFGLKGVTIGNTFGSVFDGDFLNKKTARQIGNSTFQQELEKLYKYFKGNRHVLFHTEQILIGTKILENKQEADDIVNAVINLIETSYVNIKSLL